jgi:branched-chain amino acid transport system permease protein
MTEIFGVPTQALFGQLLIGLINGSFYALLSLGLAVIFGLLNIINFTHGAQYMMGAFTGYLLLNKAGLGYWWALILAPLIVGAFGALIERTMLKQLYKLDHLYGLLLTFGLALIIQGLFRNEYGSSGQPYPIPKELQGGQNLGFMFLPIYRAWVIVASLAICFGTWYLIERTKLGSYLRAATENPQLVQAFGINVPRMITLTYGFGVGLAALAGVMAGPADGRRHHHRGVRRRGDRRHGIHHGLHHHRLRPGHRGRPDQGVLPGSLQHRDLHHHGPGADGEARRPVRHPEIVETP